MALIIASFMRESFLRTEGDDARSDLAGAPGGGKGVMDELWAEGDVKAGEYSEPQFGQKLGLPGEDASEREDGDMALWLCIRDVVRECVRAGGSDALELAVKVQV